MIRKVLVSLLLAMVIYTPVYHALGLGEIKLKSSLNEPLLAEITLLSVRGETPDQIIAKLGTAADFNRSGIDRLYFLTRIQFEAVSVGNNRMVLRLTTQDPVREPFLNFLVSLEWPNGKLLREYTVLLDPPIFDEAPAPNVTPVEQPTQVDTVRETRPQPRRTTPVETFTGDVYGPTTSNDTLWSIAAKVRSDSSISIHRAMVALYEENPQAFMSGNINRLKRGAELRIPSAEEFQQVSQREALRLIREHEMAWRSGTEVTRSVVDTSESSSSSVAESTPTEEQSGRLSLATEEQNESGSGGSNAAIAEEENLVLKQENEALEEEKRSQEERIEQLERLLELKNEQLAELQDTAQQAAEEEANAEPDNSAATQQPAAQQPVATTQPAQDKGFVDQLIDGAYNLYLAIIGIIAVVVLLIMRFRNNQSVSYQDAVEQSNTTMSNQSSPSSFSADELPDTADEVLADDTDLYGDDEMSLDESADPIGEADIYMAYGKFDQAESLLKRAISQDENRADLHAKLLECYAEMDSRASFEAHLSDVGPIIDSDTELSQIVEEVYLTAWPEGDYFEESDDSEDADDADDEVADDFEQADEADDESVEAEEEEVELDDDLSADDLDDLPSTEEVFGEADEEATEDLADDLMDLDFDTEESEDETDVDGDDAEVEADEADAEEASDEEESDEDDSSDDDIDTQLDLASAYIEMGDYEGAREIIEEVLNSGDESQKEQAQTLLDSIGD